MRNRKTAVLCAALLLALTVGGAGCWRASASPESVPADAPADGASSSRAPAASSAPQSAPALQASSAPVSSAPAPSAPVEPQRETDPAAALLAQLTLEEKVAQLFLARTPNPGETAPAVCPGGYLLFAKDFAARTAEQVRAATAELQAGAKTLLLIAVDEEGGGVVRASGEPNLRAVPFPSPQQLYAAGGMEAVEADTVEKALFLKDLGVNVNMAPVCDVAQSPGDFIYGRTFGGDAAATGIYVDRVVRQMERQGLGSVLKHFPGYGPNPDTHTGSAHDARPFEAFAEADLLPFAAGIDAGADCVLVSHNVMTCVDPVNPASLSAGVHNLLRNRLHFEGVIVTDDLGMAAVAAHYAPEQAAVAAVLAGNDLLCMTDWQQGMAAVLQAVERGVVPQAQIDEAAARVLAWKQELGLLEPVSKLEK